MLFPLAITLHQMFSRILCIYLLFYMVFFHVLQVLLKFPNFLKITKNGITWLNEIPMAMLFLWIAVKSTSCFLFEDFTERNFSLNSSFS